MCDGNDERKNILEDCNYFSIRFIRFNCNFLRSDRFVFYNEEVKS